MGGTTTSKHHHNLLKIVSGLGRECSLLFAKEGANVIATDIADEKLQDLSKVGGIVKTLKVDVTCKDDISKMAAEAGRVDVLINCAGYKAKNLLIHIRNIYFNFQFTVTQNRSRGHYFRLLR